MSELISLNDEIVKTELLLLEKQKTYAMTKRNIEIAKMTLKDTLNKKVFSNDDKREFEASKDIMISRSIKELEDFDFEIKILRIEIDYKLRLFNILLERNK